jgi:cytochrome c2
VKSLKHITQLLVGVACAVALSIGTVFVASATYFPLTSHVISTARGANLFNRHCATCHTMSADEQLRIGPSLSEIGRLASTRIPGTSAEQYIYESITDPKSFRAPGTVEEMPQSVAFRMSNTELVDLTAYLVSHGGKVNYWALADLAKAPRKGAEEPMRTIDLDVVERGRELFIGSKLQCSQCHHLDTTPGSTLLAPSLLTSGLRDRGFLEAALVDPSASIAPEYATYTVMKDGVTYSGRLLESSEHRVRLLCPDNQQSFQVREFNPEDLEPLDNEDHTLIKSSVSSMPSYKTAISDEEKHCLLEFLDTLRQ